MAAVPHRSRDRPHIGTALLGRDQEVKHRAIMPHVEGTLGQIRPRNIGAKPAHSRAGFPQSCSCDVQGGLGNIEDRQVLVSAR